jgi:hypothetical protein
MCIINDDATSKWQQMQQCNEKKENAWRKKNKIKIEENDEKVVTIIIIIKTKDFLKKKKQKKQW